MNITNDQLKKEIKTIQTIYSALIAGVAVFILVTVYVNEFGPGFGNENDQGITTILLLAGLLMSIPSILAGIYIFNKRTEKFKDKEIGEKLMIYKSAMIVRAATKEGVCFFFTTIYLITASYLGLVGAIVAFMVLIWFFPTLNRLSSELKHNFKKMNYE